jgi:hypothetical protein
MNSPAYKNDLIQQAYQNPPPKKPYFINETKSQSTNSNSISKQGKVNPNPQKTSLTNKSKKNINPL